MYVYTQIMYILVQVLLCTHYSSSIKGLIISTVPYVYYAVNLLSKYSMYICIYVCTPRVKYILYMILYMNLHLYIHTRMDTLNTYCIYIFTIYNNMHTCCTCFTRCFKVLSLFTRSLACWGREATRWRASFLAPVSIPLRLTAPIFTRALANELLNLILFFQRAYTRRRG